MLGEGLNGSDTTSFPKENVLTGAPPIGKALRAHPEPQSHNSLWLGTRGLKGVKTRVFFLHPINIPPHIYKYIYVAKHILQLTPRGKTKNKMDR
jgi:hypothetical protein